MLDNYHKSHINHLTVNDMDVRWGMYVTTCGYQTLPAGAKSFPYTKEHSSYYFNSNRGRVLDEFQLIYVVKGKGFFESTSCKRCEISAGTAILLFPGEWHNYSTTYEEDWSEYWVGFNGMNAQSMMEAQFFDKKDPLFSLGINEEFVDLYERIIRYAEDEQLGYQQIISSVVRHLLGLLYYRTQNNHHCNGAVAEKINEARLLMRECLHSPLSAVEVAERLNLSYSWFRKAFKKYTGISPSQFQMHLRLQRAKELLMDTDKTISEIAYELSFDTAGQFSTFFRQKQGSTPKYFRNRCRKNLETVIR